jgi:hypothetical protein
MDGGTTPDADRTLQDAVDRIQTDLEKPGSGKTTAATPRRLAPWMAWVAAVLLLGAAVWGWNRHSDPFAVAPEDVTLQTIQAIDLARGAVENYRAERGQLPTSLDDVGLGALPLDFSLHEGGYDITGTDGWGDPVGYHGDLGGAP